MLQKGLSESLAGRFEVIYIPHWSFTEMHDAFGFTADDFIWFGGYPGPAELITDETHWKEYIRHSLIETTPMRDILLMVRIDKPVLLRNLFDLACSWPGQMLLVGREGIPTEEFLGTLVSSLFDWFREIFLANHESRIGWI